MESIYVCVCVCVSGRKDTLFDQDQIVKLLKKSQSFEHGPQKFFYVLKNLPKIFVDFTNISKCLKLCVEFMTTHIVSGEMLLLFIFVAKSYRIFQILYEWFAVNFDYLREFSDIPLDVSNYDPCEQRELTFDIAFSSLIIIF